MAQDEEREYDAQHEESGRHSWLVMIYLAGDNNLSANCLAILQELEATRYSRDVRVLACFDSNTPRPRGARYFDVHAHRSASGTTMDWGLHDDLIPFDELPDQPVMSPDFCNLDKSSIKIPEGPSTKEGLSRFLKFALCNYSGYDRYMLILFGHGSAVAGNTFLADDNPPSFLRLKDFKEVLSRHFGDEPAHGQRPEEAEGRPLLDILACDNCMMNGIESAYQIRRQVKYVIGSQGLMLALGWPFRGVINSVVKNRNKQPRIVAHEILKTCARNLMDFSLMERSSEQSLCDLTTLLKNGSEDCDRDDVRHNLVTAARCLSGAMKDGLSIRDDTKAVKYPHIRDAIRLARLEAQSYWSETFVDLYDFCMLLRERCLNAIALIPAQGNEALIDLFVKIADACLKVLKTIKINEEDTFVVKIKEVVKKEEEEEDSVAVPSSYYVGAESQYSNGVSVYFPWTLPEEPIIFDPAPGGGGGGGSYSLSWAGVERLIAARIAAKGKAYGEEQYDGDESPEEFQLMTAFDEYRTYDFAKSDGGDWACFLEAFFHATLRNVRRFEYNYTEMTDDDFFGVPFRTEGESFFNSSPVNLQKSGSDVDSENACTCPAIKNYPRRFYLSRSDCCRRCDAPGACTDHHFTPERDEGPCVSYFGWNVRGLAAEVINLPKLLTKPSRAVGDRARTEAGREPEGS